MARHWSAPLLVNILLGIPGAVPFWPLSLVAPLIPTAVLVIAAVTSCGRGTRTHSARPSLGSRSLRSRKRRWMIGAI